tara:strand:- start:76 stop:249 length:174 start_codon:yes stop_codon:yes gene_type:complete
MGEAKRRKEQGLPPKGPKQLQAKAEKKAFFKRYPRLPLYLAGLFVIILIIDLIKELG